MKIFKLVLFAFLVGGFVSCSEDIDDVTGEPATGGERDLTVEKFVYRGMNNIYLYKSDVPQLANNYFSTQDEKEDFLDNYETPEDLFYDGLVASQDRFSWIVDDYVELENSFSGISTTTGMSYALSYISSGSSNIFGYVRYVLPGTSAEAEGVKRGDIFTKIDGEQLTDSNYSSLLAPQSFTIGLASLDGNDLSETGETITLSKQEYQSNPVYIAKTFEFEGTTIGYLMYNSFTDDFDEELNDAFGKFQADGIEKLILDVRYNGGGSVRTATDLAAMITGQFPGEIFLKEEWNEEYQEYFEEEDPDRLINRFNTNLTTGTAINSLNLDKVYVLTTGRSASASELIINGLEPYIDVVQIGETTTGKFTASVTLYDSPNFGRQNVNTSHTYAIQPLVFKSVNKDGVSDYVNGLAPDIEFKENVRGMGILGEQDEPLLNAALNAISGNRMPMPADFKTYKPAGESGMEEPNYQRMYIDKVPAVINE